MKRTVLVFVMAAAVMMATGCGSSEPAAAGAPGQASAGKPGGEKKEGVKPFAEVITKEARSDSGVFTVHRVKQKWYYEIPAGEIGKEFLLVTTQAKVQSGLGYGGDYLNIQVVRWDRAGDRVLLRSILHNVAAADSLPIAYSVEKASNPPILAAFDLQAYNKDSSAVVVDVTEFYTTDMTEIGLSRGAREQFKVRRLDGKRSFIDSVVAFPTNVEVDVTLTYDAGQVPVDNALSTITVTLHHSMVRLPDRPMMPRLADDRVGFFTTEQIDYGIKSQRAERRTYITRWRLEPADSAAYAAGQLVEPKKPIVFYVDRGVPDVWRPWLKKGIEDWKPAFEKAGFRNAIVAKDPPDPKDDPDWRSEDARYSTIRWLPSPIENAYGPSIADPRSGEILDADIGFFHNVMNLARNWYFVQTGGVDQRTDRLPLPDSLMGELLRYIAAHEVGHSLGFPHNMKATSQYPVDSLRSRTFTERYGTEASIMDYGRFNYVAQPGDNARLIPLVGPYDHFAAEWGYRYFPGAASPDDEKPMLNRIAARQETEPYLRFGDPSAVDPSAQTEDLGADPIAATRYGLANIKRVMDKLHPATTIPGEDYETLQEMYTQVIAQRNRELGHVVGLIGGVTQTTRVAGQAGVVHEPVARARQKAALDFLIAEGFRTPTEIIRPDILALIEPTGTPERVLSAQRNLLEAVMNNARMARLVAQEGLAAPGARPYTLAEMLADLRKGVWSEIYGGAVDANIYRRNLQRAYLDAANARINPAPQAAPAGMPAAFAAFQSPPPGEAKALLRSELIDLDGQIARALPRASTREMKAHLTDARARISLILNPEGK
jgi:hypothetical protein